MRLGRGGGWQTWTSQGSCIILHGDRRRKIKRGRTIKPGWAINSCQKCCSPHCALLSIPECLLPQSTQRYQSIIWHPAMWRPRPETGEKVNYSESAALMLLLNTSGTPLDPPNQSPQWHGNWHPFAYANNDLLNFTVCLTFATFLLSSSLSTHCWATIVSDATYFYAPRFILLPSESSDGHWLWFMAVFSWFSFGISSPKTEERVAYLEKDQGCSLKSAWHVAGFVGHVICLLKTGFKMSKRDNYLNILGRDFDFIEWQSSSFDD